MVGTAPSSFDPLIPFTTAVQKKISTGRWYSVIESERAISLLGSGMPTLPYTAQELEDSLSLPPRPGAAH
eukprot:scaffold88207_cov27-Tisochrysis_lutea.AAC.1